MNRLILLALAGVIALTSCEKTDRQEPDDNMDNTYHPIELTKSEMQVADGANAFGLDVYHSVYKDEQMLFSPLSLSLALSMTALGADGMTASQMCTTLGFDGIDADDIASYYRKMTESLATIDRRTTFDSANSIWSQEGFTVKKDFLKTAQDFFNAEIRTVDFRDQATVGVINGWCSEKTHGMVEKILDRVDPSQVMSLINAIYFKGQWNFKFDEKTEKSTFHTIDGKKVKVDMMKVRKELYASFVDDWSSVRLPYGNGAFAMEVILPPSGMAFGDAVKAFDEELVSKLSVMRDKHEVTLKMPEFKFEYGFKELKEVLASLGMPLAFSSMADFSKMAEVPDGNSFFIGTVSQKCAIEVNTKGTEAAAVTHVGMFLESAMPPGGPVTFTVDRPFIFMIREASTGALLFIGQKVN